MRHLPPTLILHVEIFGKVAIIEIVNGTYVHDRMKETSYYAHKKS